MPLAKRLAMVTLAMSACSLPAYAASDYPRASVGGYIAINYELESLIPSQHVNPEGEDTAPFARLPFHVGQISLYTMYELSENIDGILEILPRAKGKPSEYADEYQDIVGNGVDTPMTVLGRAEVTFRDLPMASAFTVGQMRVPFGLWDDFSVHSKLFTAKNDTSIFGSGLRRIDSGAKLEGNLLGDGLLTYRLAAVGRSDSPTVNNLELSDFVARLGSSGSWGDLGFSAYLADAKEAPVGQKRALGIDYTFFLPLNLSLIGEYVAQADDVAGLDVQGVYTRLNCDLSDMVPGLRAYVGYEHTGANSGANKGVESKEVGGLRYRLAPGCTLGGDVLYGDKYPEGNFIARVETQF